MALLAFILLLLQSVLGDVIISDNGVDSSQCLEGMCPCRSLKYVAIANTSSINNTVIRFNSNNYTLDGVAQFTGVDNIIITGQEHSKTIITCNTTNGGGLSFVNSTNINLAHFVLHSCGILVPIHLVNFTSRFSAILLQESSDVIFRNIQVSSSLGQGITLLNTHSVLLSHCILCGNGHHYGGGGLLIFAINRTFNTNSSSCKIVIDSSNFSGNYGVHNKQDQRYVGSIYSNRGGGVRVLLFSQLCHSGRIEMINSSIVDNTAVFGGGLFICISFSVNHFNVTLNSTELLRNQANATGGGADIGYTTYKSNSVTAKYPSNNSITFHNVTFEGNNASYGGGLSVFAATVSYFSKHPQNMVNCSNCCFRKNTANGGAAVEVSLDSLDDNGEQYLTSVSFTNCKFIRNFLSLKNNKAIGTLYSTYISISFHGHILFEGNDNTALCLTSADLIIGHNTTLQFKNNTGTKGGAILLLSGSSIFFDNNTKLCFINNSATYYGGAIASLPQILRKFSYLESCFLKARQNDIISLNFKDNSAILGSVLFATSLSPCIDFCREKTGHNLSINQIFTNSCLWKFSYEHSTFPVTKRISTNPAFIDVTGPLYIIPGVEYKLELSLLDEVGNSVTSLFPLTVNINDCNNITIDQQYSILSDNIIKLLGKPNQNGSLLLETMTVPSIQKTVPFILTQCPPGFQVEKNACKCNRKNHVECWDQTAYLPIGYWIGSLNNCNDSSSLFVGNCAIQLCKIKDLKNGHYKLLEKHCVLEQAICGDTRTGRLCGRCTENYSVYYHSENYTCGNSSSCSYGVPLYVLSELLPVTVLFLVILVFNISLTSGALYSFVFYAQVISALDITAFGIIKHNTVIEVFQIFYGFFNMEILSNEGLSYCLIQTNTIMNLLMFKYATTLYAFLLVLGTILVLKLHSCYSCVRLCRRCGRRNIRGSIIDGLSAFIVLCYSQCALTTSKILVRSVVLSQDKTEVRQYPLFDGELEYLHGKHLYYAVPAFLCLVVILLPPPLILLLEPLLTKLFSFDCLRRTYVRLLYNRIRLKMMPFLDSFQSCFKDKHRYFAGLYFIYRLIAPLLMIVSSDTSVFFIIAVLSLFVILFLHSLIQPYKKKWHSLQEIFLFINLVMLYFLTYSGYLYTIYDEDKEKNVMHIVYLQVILLFIPIVCLTCYIIHHVYQRIKQSNNCLKRKTTVIETDLTSNSSFNNYGFPARLLSNSFNNYKSFTETN